MVDGHPAPAVTGVQPDMEVPDRNRNPGARCGRGDSIGRVNLVALGGSVKCRDAIAGRLACRISAGKGDTATMAQERVLRLSGRDMVFITQRFSVPSLGKTLGAVSVPARFAGSPSTNGQASRGASRS
jgi:hypothetical protein